MKSKKRTWMLVTLLTLSLPILWWFVFGAGVPVTKNLRDIGKVHDVIITAPHEQYEQRESRKLKQSENTLYSLQSYKTEEALYDAVKTAIPNGTDLEEAENILVNKVGLVRVSGDENDKGIYAIKYSNPRESASIADVRNVMVRYDGQSDQVLGISVQIPHAKTPFLWYPRGEVTLTPVEVNNGH
ncbi:MAG: hypothetical protein ABW072_11715 [Sedimenticola sp.]